MDISINYWAVIVATIVAWVFGALWYSPALFGKQWLRYVGPLRRAEGEVRKEQDELGSPARSMTAMFIATFIMAYVLANIVQYFGAATWLAGAQAGFWMWLGFVLTSTAGVYLFEGRSKNLYYIYNGYQLIGLVLMGIIIAIW